MRIVKQGHVNPFPVALHCEFCNSDLEIDFEDVRSHVVKASGGNIRDSYDYTEYFVECPVCGSKAALKDKEFLNTYHTERIIRERRRRVDWDDIYNHT